MNKRTRSISLIVTAIMLVSLLVAYPAFKATADDTNYATSGTYTIAKIVDGSEADATYLNADKTDDGARLKDGKSNTVETNGASVAFTGTGATHRVKFDLGATKSGVNKVVIKNLIRTSNRNFGDTVTVKAGTTTSVSDVSAQCASALTDGSSYTLTAVFTAVDARYVYIDINSGSGYILTFDEVEIWASSNATVPPTTTTEPEETVAPTPGNYAMTGTYTIASLTDGTEGAASFLASYPDNSFKLLNNGKTFTAETSGQSVGLQGTGKTHRFKFDLGALKTGINKIIIKNAIDSANELYNGSPAGNRGIDTESIVVKAGAATGSMNGVTVTTTVTDNGENYSKQVTLQFSAIDARYVYIDITSKGYILSLDEIEIWGSEGGTTPVDSKFELSASVPESVEAGATFDVEIEAKNITATNGLVGVDFTLKFDAAKVTAVYTTDDAMAANFFKANPGNRWEDAGCYYNASSNLYNIRFADQDATTQYGIKADATLIFKVAFTAKSDLAAGTTISFTVADVIGTDPGDASYNGFGDVAGTGSAAALVVAEVTTTTEEETTTTEAPTTTEPTVTVKYGDVDGNGKVNANDARKVAQAAVRIVTLTDTEKLAADVDGNGKVNANDARLIAQYAVRLISKFPVEA